MLEVLCPRGVRLWRTAALGGLRSFLGPTKGFAAFTGDCGFLIEFLADSIPVKTMEQVVASYSATSDEVKVELSHG